MRLSRYDQVPIEYRPGYDPGNHETGIVHLGLGSFHKAHQAAMTDTVLEKQGGDWRILGVSLRSDRAMQEIGPQNGLFSLLIKGVNGTRCRVIGALSGAICTSKNSSQAIEAMASPTTKIVSLTVTEKAYGFDRSKKGCDPDHPVVAEDLKKFDHPKGVLGLLTKALDNRRHAQVPPFTVLCCDNLPSNGRLLKAAVVDFAMRIDPELATWIEKTTAFPSTMVDRITPAPSPRTLEQAENFIGLQDLAAVEAEEFSQWVIEDDFPQGRPDWDIAGAIFTEDVSSFEKMKLRMLNGAHSMLAYAGFHSGHQYVRDVMQNPSLAGLVERYIKAAAQTLPEIEGIDFMAYSASLLDRFRNPSIAHETFQIAMDGSEKMPQRIFAALSDARALKNDTRPFAFAIAAWLRHISGATHDCDAYELRDPRAKELSKVVMDAQPHDLLQSLVDLNVVQSDLTKDNALWSDVHIILTDMLTKPMTEVIKQETVS
jgi:fructuronate reductase